MIEATKYDADEKDVNLEGNWSRGNTVFKGVAYECSNPNCHSDKGLWVKDFGEMTGTLTCDCGCVQKNYRLKGI